MIAFELLAEPDVAPFIWPIIIPALVPPVVVAYFFWSLLPSIRAVVPAGFACWNHLGGTLILCVSIWSMVQIRHLAIGHEAALRAKWDASGVGGLAAGAKC
jgi:hypothetical protein